jgi:hypothetical protein
VNQVDRITCCWNGIFSHVLGGPEDARDIYVKQTRLPELMDRPGFHVRYEQMPLQQVSTEAGL